jgi:RNA-directed DNA polymerase
VWDYGLRTEIRLVLGDASLAGDWNEDALEARARAVLAIGPAARWLAPLVRRTLETYRDAPNDRRREFHGWLDAELRKLASRERPVAVTGRLFPVAAMGRMRWPVPEIATTTELAGSLDLHLHELDWLADARGWEPTAASEPLRNYRYRWIPRAGGPPRLLECPKRHLKELKGRLLHQILDLVPPHPDAHGFRLGHSELTNARRHAGQEVVIGFDLEDFFAPVSAGRIYRIFRGVGYPEEVAHRLTALCTNVVPREDWCSLAPPDDPRELGRRYRLGKRLGEPHLPQGGPTSAALANLGAHVLDRRLSALAAVSGATYSRYADDLTFLGGKQLLARAIHFRRLVGEIVADEGFRLNARKSRLTTRAGRQIVTDIVVNDRPNLARRDYDTLKAIIHDASRRGPEQANQANVPDFRSHLLGRITWAEQLNPERGARLRRAFATISWWLNPAPWSHGEHAPAMRVEGGSTPPGVSCRLRRHDGRTAGTP